MIYPKNLKMIKGCPQIIIKGKPRDPLDSFDNTNSISHSYLTWNNPHPIVLVSLPPSQLILPQAPKFLSTFMDYNLVDQLHATPAKITLWELLQTSLTYNEALQKALSNLPASPPNQDNIHSILDSMHAMPSIPPIVFSDNDLPSLEVQNQYDALMVVVSIN